MIPTEPTTRTASGADAEALHLARSFPPKPVSFVRGLAHNLYTADGTAYVDLGGASHGVANFGHNHPRIVEAIQQQARDLIYCTNTVPSPVRAAMLEGLHRILPPHLSRTFLANSGTEAIEAAVKFAVAKTGRKRFVAARNAFHGRSLGALSATFRPQYRQPFAALLHETAFVPLNDVAALETAVRDDVAGIILEPVQGEGGLAVATSDYLRAAERLAHQHGALLIIDEIQTGMGRTGTDLAIQESGVRPDILCLGKSLAGGLPVGTTSMTEEVAARMPAGGHGTTFGGSPIVCAAAAAALEVLRENQLSAVAHASGEHLRKALADLGSPLVREVRGRGLMLGVDLRVRAQGILDQMLQRRFLALAAGPTVVRWLPPLATPRAVLDEAVACFAQAVAGQAPPAPTPGSSPKGGGME